MTRRRHDDHSVEIQVWITSNLSENQLAMFRGVWGRMWFRNTALQKFSHFSPKIFWRFEFQPRAQKDIYRAQSQKNWQFLSLRKISKNRNPPNSLIPFRSPSCAIPMRAAAHLAADRRDSTAPRPARPQARVPITDPVATVCGERSKNEEGGGRIVCSFFWQAIRFFITLVMEWITIKCKLK